jgi:hypothetical protein
MEDWAYMMVYSDGSFFSFCANVPVIFSPKHHQIQKCCQNYPISAIKLTNSTYSTALPKNEL